MTRTHFRAGMAAAAWLLAGAASAAQLTVSSYSMPNGDGQAHGGNYNYWDGTYNGAGNPALDGSSGSFLSGGTGALTDGVVAFTNWSALSNNAGTGQYVGWVFTNPTITFNFASAVTINEIKLYVDNSHDGGVTSPSSVTVNGVDYANPTWAGATLPQTIDITGLAITGHSVSVTLTNPGYWVMLSEAQFYGTPAVPEAGSTAMALAGLATLGLMARRRKLQ
jgi:MYXO-CTERM domain-containing protein